MDTGLSNHANEGAELLYLILYINPSDEPAIEPCQGACLARFVNSSSSKILRSAEISVDMVGLRPAVREGATWVTTNKMTRAHLRSLSLSLSLQVHGTA